MRWIRPPSGEEYLTVLMPPKHFVAYQQWLAGQGLRLFILPTSVRGPHVYSITQSDERYEAANRPERPRRTKHGALRDKKEGTT